MSDWSGRKVVILGAARQGTALARYLVHHGAWVVLSDRRPANELQSARESLADLSEQVAWVCGDHPLSLLDGADLLCISGGVPLSLPLVATAQDRGIPLSNDSQIFLEAAPCRVIGITGSAGKTTTTTLVGRMAHAASGVNGLGQVYIGGNIGSPLVAEVDKMGADDLAVMELSSFQLEIMTRSPQVAAVLNVTPNHLDRHGTMEAYTAAKARILNFQKSEDIAILGRDDPGAWRLEAKVQGRLFSFGTAPAQGPGTFLRDGQIYLDTGESQAWIMSRERIQLRGDHNLLNVLAACAISAAAGLPLDAMRTGVEGFGGVRHRLEFVRRWGGASWYNDSIATAPERAMAAIRSFEEPLVLLAGGRDKDLPWEEFAALVRRRVKHLIVFGEAADKVAQAVAAVPGNGPTLTRCEDLEGAVTAASQVAQPGDVILLSPGGTSFDEFRDFEERGECFIHLVMQL